MKILSLRLKNLASITGEYFIDFESEPLASAGLIAIVGKTGAGKSTLLDAMCLALFNQIPRLKHSDGKIKDADGSELLTNSPLTVLRRGTGHGFAEICFVAQDQKTYLARWEIKRARENANGKLQSVQRYLKCLTDGVVVADKNKAVEQHIQKITQLSFEQFTRAVLLAQSEVTIFLKARDNERGELLEYLTNSSIFAKIGQLAFEKTKDISNQRKQIENVLGHIEILSDEEATQLAAQSQQIQLQLQQLETEKTTLNQQRQWFDQQHKLNDEIVLKQQNLDHEQQSHNSLNTQRQLLEQLSIFSEIRPIAFQQQQLLKTQQKIDTELKNKQSDFNGLETQFNQEKQLYLKAESELSQIQSFEQTHQTELTQIRKYIQERDYIVDEYKKSKAKLSQVEQQQTPLLKHQHQLEQEINHLNQSLAKNENELKNSQHFAILDQGLSFHLQQLEQFIIQYQQIEKSLGNITQAEVKLKNDQDSLHTLITQFGNSEQIEQKLMEHQKSRDQQIEKSNQLLTLQNKLESYFSITLELEELKTHHSKLSYEIQEIEQKNKTAEHNFQTEKLAREQIQQLLQQQRLLHTENIEHLRSNLKADEPCLVCGSTTHPYRDDESLISKALYQLHEQQESQALQQEQQSFEHWQTTQKQFTHLQTALSQVSQSLSQLQVRLEQQKNDLSHLINSSKIQLNLSESSHIIQEKLQQIISQLNGEKTQTEHSLQQLNHAYKMQQQLSKIIQQIESQLQKIQQSQQNIQQILSCLSQNESTLWQTETLNFSQKIFEKLQHRLQHLDAFKALEKQREQNQQQLILNKSEITNHNKQLDECTQQLKEIENKGQQNTDHAHQLIVSLIGETELKAHDWLNQHDQQHQHALKQYQLSKTHFEQARNVFDGEKQALENIKTQYQHNLSTLQKIQTEVTGWLNIHTDFNQEKLHELLMIPADQEQQIRAQLQQADRLLNEATSAVKTLQEQLNIHLKLEPNLNLEQLSVAIQNNLNVLSEEKIKYDDVKVQLEIHQKNLERQKQFAAQIQNIQEQEHRWNKISSLIGDASGKKFRDNAQQYHLDILLEYANQQLAMLSQRYTLKRLENSLSLAIIDHDMDGEERSVASLSGGESFLTALALSLAIANMASGSMKIESLFIDEGFGTLDSSSLHMVMNALDQLQNQGRKVVLISHIQDMHERIPVQIQVTPIGAGASQIDVVG